MPQTTTPQSSLPVKSGRAPRPHQQRPNVVHIPTPIRSPQATGLAPVIGVTPNSLTSTPASNQSRHPAQQYKRRTSGLRGLAYFVGDTLTRAQSPQPAEQPQDGGLYQEDLAHAVTHYQYNSNGKIGHTASRLNWQTAHFHVAAAVAISQDPTTSPDQVRTRHIDAIRYLNMELPPDLSLAEIGSIYESFPPEIRARLQNSRPTHLRNVVSKSTFYFIGCLIILLPKLRDILGWVQDMDQKYLMRKWVWVQAIQLTTSFRQSRLGQLIGPLIAASIAWVCDGMLGGIHDGIKKSLRESPDAGT